VINTEKGLLQIRLSAKFSGEEGAKIPVYAISAGERPNVIPGLATAEIGCDDMDGLEVKLRETSLSVSAERMENGHVLLTSVGAAGHASMPQHGKNAAGQLLLALHAIGAGGGCRGFLECLADGIGLDYTGKGLGVDGADSVSGPLTLNLGILRVGDGHAEAVIDIRHPVLMSADAIVKMIGMHVSEVGIKIEVNGAKGPLHVPGESKIVRDLLSVYHEVTGLPPYTIAIGGGTYSRSMDHCVAFGCNFPGDPELAHQAEECIETDKLLLNVRIFAHAIARLACQA
jgi:succinyl-diaminopimelate desuccinylase